MIRPIGPVITDRGTLTLMLIDADPLTPELDVCLRFFHFKILGYYNLNDDAQLRFKSRRRGT